MMPQWSPGIPQLIVNHRLAWLAYAKLGLVMISPGKKNAMGFPEE
jgi:hypothetical protein